MTAMTNRCTECDRLRMEGQTLCWRHWMEARGLELQERDAATIATERHQRATQRVRTVREDESDTVVRLAPLGPRELREQLRRMVFSPVPMDEAWWGRYVTLHRLACS